MELLDTWDESFKVNEEKGISVKDIPWFLNHVQRNYVGKIINFISS